VVVEGRAAEVLVGSKGQKLPEGWRGES
jgi:hypothetical protein